MRDRTKRIVGLSVFSLGIVGGLFGCAAAPRAIFTLGINDSLPEIFALLLPLTLLPVSILALWKRKPASYWLLSLSAIWLWGMSWQRHYMTGVRHFSPDTMMTFLAELAPSYFVFLLGVFGVAAESARWPTVMKSRNENS